MLILLKIGDKIEVIKKTDIKLRYEGMETPWYKIKYQNKVGYVVGSLISLDKAVINDLIYLVSLKKDGTKLFVKTRLLQNNKDYIENVSQLYTSEFSIKACNNKGLENITSVFEIDYLAESCGVNGGGIYLFFNGKELIKAIDYAQIGDADLYWFIEEYIFPTDKDGISGKILYKREVGETKDYETEWVETKLTRRILEWKDNKIFPKIETEEK